MAWTDEARRRSAEVRRARAKGKTRGSSPGGILYDAHMGRMLDEQGKLMKAYRRRAASMVKKAERSVNREIDHIRIQSVSKVLGTYKHPTKAVEKRLYKLAGLTRRK